jgi:hypothetical protein
LIGHMPHPEMAELLVRTAPKILAFRRRHGPPFIARIYRRSSTSSDAAPAGRIDLSYSLDDWNRDVARHRRRPQ